MDLVISTLQIPIEKDGNSEYLRAASDLPGMAEGDVAIVKILSKSLDMSDPEQFYYRVSLVVRVDDGFENREGFPLYKEELKERGQALGMKERPIIVGFGPAGIFAALELVDRGLRPLIFERGRKIEERSLDVLRFIKERELDTESNIQFGEGGAGSYSDGKLFSRRNNNTGYVNRVLNTFVRFGAPEEIVYMAKPHLGTDMLCKIVRNMRNYIIERGGEIHFSSKMTDLIIEGGRALGIVINDEKEYFSPAVYIALGHSARDSFEMMHKKGVSIEAKPVSIGVRIEHPAETIDLMRYGNKYKGFPGLGAATYSLNYTNRKIRRGVYTFCMCPGGEVVNASSEPGMLVLNGMSYSQRSSPFSNAALVVSCHGSDYSSKSPLAGIEFQRDIEKKAFRAGGGGWKAPAQNLVDFLGDHMSDRLNENSFKMGVVPSDMREIFPPFAICELKAAFNKWREEVPLFISSSAILLAAETRAASPLRISRNERFESVNVKGLYPLGEGSGYAGGITSSAADAIKAVDVHLS